ncbi:uncharacterized protein J3D65DRAFT_368699 [Phyllosticta citribraziliensis]|uniref:BTB domain-containing protein n=1 Tax=Phyllosticta citribraziliensis TaxID=989973 RepID=A0ABR1LPQ0_9PEZI
MLPGPSSEGPLVAAKDAGPPATSHTPQDPDLNHQDEQRRSLVASGEKANLIFKLHDGQTVKAHKSIVYKNCPFFALLKDEPQENITTVKMSVGSATTLKALLGFIYFDNFDLESLSPAQLVLDHLDVWIMGYTCGLPVLQSIAETRFEAALKQKSLDLWLVMPRLVREVYRRTWSVHTRVRQLVVEIATNNLRELSQNKDFKEALEHSSAFAFDIAHTTAQKLSTAPSSALQKSGKELDETKAALQKTHKLLRDCGQALYVSEQSKYWTDQKLQQVLLSLNLANQNWYAAFVAWKTCEKQLEKAQEELRGLRKKS